MLSRDCLSPQLQLDRSEWGSDLPSVEMHLENHKGVHRAIEEFQMSLKDAKLSEVKRILHSRAAVLGVLPVIPLFFLFFFQIQMNLPLKLTYSDKLNKLEKQYEALLVRQLSVIKSCAIMHYPNFLIFFILLSHFAELLE